MTIENKLGITESAALAKEEERLTKKRALELYETGKLGEFEVGTFAGLSAIHGYLFQDVYDFAGKLRTENIAKGSFRFAPVMYLEGSLQYVDGLPQRTFDEIVEKYVEMNVIHPFREGNGRATRMWLDQIFKSELGMVVDWSQVDKDDYLLAMERSPIKDTEIKHILRNAVTDDIENKETFMKGVDASYYYEGYYAYKVSDLARKPVSADQIVGSDVPNRDKNRS